MRLQCRNPSRPLCLHTAPVLSKDFTRCTEDRQLSQNRRAMGSCGTSWRELLKDAGVNSFCAEASLQVSACSSWRFPSPLYRWNCHHATKWPTSLIYRQEFYILVFKKCGHGEIKWRLMLDSVGKGILYLCSNPSGKVPTITLMSRTVTSNTEVQYVCYAYIDTQAHMLQKHQRNHFHIYFLYVHIAAALNVSS